MEACLHGLASHTLLLITRAVDTSPMLLLIYIYPSNIQYFEKEGGEADTMKGFCLEG
jgi:hypothetical protein